MLRQIVHVAVLAAGLAAGAGGYGALGHHEPVPPRQEEPEPHPAFEILKQDLGSWTATIKVINALTGEEVVSRGTEINKLGPGDTTIITDFRGRILDKAFVGHGVTGFDDKGRLVEAWTDNRAGKLRFLEGKLEAGATERVLLGESRFGNELYKERHTVHYEDARHRRFTIETQGSDGKWITALEISYSKR